MHHRSNMISREDTVSIFIYEPTVRRRSYYSEALASSYTLYFSPNGKDVFEEINIRYYDVIILSLSGNAGGLDPFDLLQWIKLTLPYTPVIVTGETEDVDSVVRSIKLGAFNYVVLPISVAKLRLIIQQALENRSLKNEIDYLRRHQDVIYDFSKIIAFSPVMKRIIETLKKFSKTDATILMMGDTGTGKSFLAGTIHFNSIRREKPFVTINCANIPETLLESELFGHEKGSFTGADKLRVGRFEQAKGGTIFLDEIGEINLSTQAKLLRVIENKSFERIGGNKTIHSDVRIIAATNRNLEKQISEGKFREDLYYRINILSVTLPPLRERREDIEPLSYWLLEGISTALKKKVKGFSHDGMEWLKSSDWPGNIRQLSNTIERALILEETDIIRKRNIISDPSVIMVHNRPSSPKDLRSSERDMIIDALENCLWIQKDAARRLGISPRVLNYKIKKYDITHSRWRKNVGTKSKNV